MTYSPLLVWHDMTCVWLDHSQWNFHGDVEAGYSVMQNPETMYRITCSRLYTFELRKTESGMIKKLGTTLQNGLARENCSHPKSMTWLTLHEVDQTSNYYKMSGLQVQTSDKAGNRTWNQDESGYSMVLYKIVWLGKWFCSNYISPPSNNLARSTEWPDLQKVSSVSGLIVVSLFFFNFGLRNDLG